MSKDAAHALIGIAGTSDKTSVEMVRESRESSSTLALNAALERRLGDAQRAVWAVDDALSRGHVSTLRPDGGHYTRMGRIAALIDHRNRLEARCRAAGLPID